MADNTQLNLATTVGDVIATDDIGGVKHQRVKVQYGDDGAATDVSPTNPLPVTVTGNNVSVDVQNTPSVNATIVTGDTVPVDIQNTPSVNVSNTPSVNATIVTGDTVPVDVQNTLSVNVSNTPSVNATIVTGDTVPVDIQNTPSVNATIVTGDTVPVDVQNTLSVNVSNTPSVNATIVTGDTVPVDIQNTPSVDIATAQVALSSITRENYVTFEESSFDTNVTGSVTSSFYIGAYNNVGFELTGDTGTHSGHVAVVQYSIDNSTWWDSSLSLIGSGATEGTITFNYIRAKVTVAEGGTSTSTVKFIAN